LEGRKTVLVMNEVLTGNILCYTATVVPDFCQGLK